MCAMTSAPPIIGLTGGIGSGKSAACEHFAALGAAVVDTDAIAHELTTAGGAAIDLIRETFGEQVIQADGALNRTAMRERVFSDPAARLRLEAILHPMIRQLSLQRCANTTRPYVILAIPLLIETGAYHEHLTRICVVDCPVELQVARVMARNAMSEPQVRAIIAAQASRAQRQAVADDLIDNSGDLAALWQQVERLHEHYLQHAARPL